MVIDGLRVDITKWQFYSIRKYAMQIIDGSITEKYVNLWDYFHELLTSNPGSTMKMQCKDIGGAIIKFERLYVYLDACKKRLLGGYRPIVGVDDYFIKGFHKG